LILAETERSESTEGVRVSFCRARLDVAAVSFAIGVTKYEPHGDASFDDESSLVHGAMMCGTDDDQRIRIVPSALGAKLDVMHIHEHRVTTTRHDAAAAVATDDLTADRGGHILSCGALLRGMR
jgi:hypothetical protein